ncbi:hypothetical protein BO71DRAFT_126264 [Aspergillus ellipticus CBS 707.79]|uniref:LysM domain-containing protein n=1 Tax=Aspergillus ellipticus CBS 707.79 TaxID=1448320 RepID=A0A319DTS8_9EURO|nr:hypothetical protein BO71DRAFT_126264 [Aspergillus ellipticus CBS 707.79]
MCRGRRRHRNTYSEYPTPTVTYTFTRPPPSGSFTPSPVTTQAQYPTAPGTIEKCVVYQNAFDVNFSEGAETRQWHAGGERGPRGNTLNSCQKWSDSEVTVSDLITWNPSLNATSCTLKSG